MKLRRKLKGFSPISEIYGWSSVLSHGGVLFHGSYEVWHVKVGRDNELKQSKVAVFSDYAECLRFVNEKNGTQA